MRHVRYRVFSVSTAWEFSLDLENSDYSSPVDLDSDSDSVSVSDSDLDLVDSFDYITDCNTAGWTRWD